MEAGKAPDRKTSERSWAACGAKPRRSARNDAGIRNPAVDAWSRLDSSVKNDGEHLSDVLFSHAAESPRRPPTD